MKRRPLLSLDSVRISVTRRSQTYHFGSNHRPETSTASSTRPLDTSIVDRLCQFPHPLGKVTETFQVRRTLPAVRPRSPPVHPNFCVPPTAAFHSLRRSFVRRSASLVGFPAERRQRGGRRDRAGARARRDEYTSTSQAEVQLEQALFEVRRVVAGQEAMLEGVPSACSRRGTSSSKACPDSRRR